MTRDKRKQLNETIRCISVKAKTELHTTDTRVLLSRDVSIERCMIYTTHIPVKNGDPTRSTPRLAL